MMMQSIHGHSLLNHLLDLGGSESLDLLRQWAHSSHGPDARYHTCSAQGLTYDSLMQFLLERNKNRNSQPSRARDCGPCLLT